ncbi:MAG: hypothetical protein IKX23_09335 [Treponema sp.]|nr:hypothetical protein [Treponema sp.]
MKKPFLLLIVLILFSAGCKKQRANPVISAQNSVKDILEQQTDGSLTILPNSVISTKEQTLEGIKVPSIKSLTEKAKKTMSEASRGLIDLTNMNSTMIYSQVFEMMIMPEDYENTDIKVKGFLQVYNYEGNPDKYLSVIIPDATQCCQQGIEFIWPDKQYPQDYPAPGTPIEVTGRFCITYTEEELLYTFMQLSDLKILSE